MSKAIQHCSKPLADIIEKYGISSADAMWLITHSQTPEQRCLIEASTLEAAANFIDIDCGYVDAMAEGDEYEANSCIRELSSDDLRAMGKKKREEIPFGQLEPVSVAYTNWKGQTQERHFVPNHLWFGSTEWHPEPQWLIRGWDTDKQALRDYALEDIGAVGKLGYVDIKTAGCEGWINLFWGEAVIAMISYPELAKDIKDAGVRPFKGFSEEKR